MTDHPAPPTPTGGGSEDSRAEQVLSQALRVMAGGGRTPDSPPAADRGGTRRLSTSQLILLAAIIGLLIGICAGFISLTL